MEENPATCSKDASAISELIDHRALHAVFQPILSLGNGDILGYEGLVRGPADSALHTPCALFAAALGAGLRSDIERLSQEVVAAAFKASALPGKLFLNVSPRALASQNGDSDPLLAHLKRLELPPSRVIIEITENEPTLDFPLMRQVISHYRQLGFGIAIDDLGEGFASLRLWSELHPDYVKLDMHFTQGVSRDPLKLQFVKAIHQIAQTSSAQVIAEGIESEADLRVIRDLGIGYGQGHFIARPAANPPTAAPTVLLEALMQRRIAVYPDIGRYHGRKVTLHRLVVEVKPVSPQDNNGIVYGRFDRDPGLMILPVVHDAKPLGLIYRYDLIDRFARPYRRELFAKRPCTTFMDADPLVVDVNMSVQELSALVVEAERSRLSEGFVITDQGRYLGIGKGTDLMREITQMQLSAARYANPLTLLPGNVPITEHMGRLLEARQPFCVCHCDLDNFKPYNDVFGYSKGDEVILLTARVLQDCCDPVHDFLGHVGGDDFIVLFQSGDWEARCSRALGDFEHHLRALLPAMNTAGGFVSQDRRGQEVFHPFPSLSVGAVTVEAGVQATPLDLSSAAAEAKRQAKRIAGNSLFVERRKLSRASQCAGPVPMP